MRIWFSPYQLQPLNALNALDTGKSREGVLLKIELNELGVGYADCHSWMTFGDANWRDQIKSLQEDRPLPLISRSLELAQWDASFRHRGESLFPSAPLLKSHYTLADYSQFSLPLLEQIVEQDFNILKLKLGSDLQRDFGFLRRLLPIIPEGLRIRLDFNSTMTPEVLGPWLGSLGHEFLGRLDFIEDPFEYDAEIWLAFKEKWQVRLAIDQSLSSQSDLRGADVLVVKPGRTSGEVIDHCVEKWGDKRWVFTHAMDHPVGRMMALAFAMNFYLVNPEKEDVGGFESSSIYESSSFDEQIFQQGALQLGTEGKGVGFDAQLEELEWNPLHF